MYLKIKHRFKAGKQVTDECKKKPGWHRIDAIAKKGKTSTTRRGPPKNDGWSTDCAGIHIRLLHISASFSGNSSRPKVYSQSACQVSKMDKYGPKSRLERAMDPPRRTRERNVRARSIRAAEIDKIKAHSQLDFEVNSTPADFWGGYTSHGVHLFLHSENQLPSSNHRFPHVWSQSMEVNDNPPQQSGVCLCVWWTTIFVRYPSSIEGQNLESPSNFCEHTATKDLVERSKTNNK